MLEVDHGGKRPGAGRKALYGDALTERTTVKSMPGERDAWKKKAGKMPLNLWIRETLNTASKK